MADVITETDIRKFTGMSRAILPTGAILTPAAKDWALEHHLAISFGSGHSSEFPGVTGEGKDREVFLRQVVKSVVDKMKQTGTSVSNDVVVTIVIGCMERMGCRVK